MLSLLPEIPPPPPSRRLLRRGFSLIELAVVLAIIGVVAAVAVPAYLRQRDSAPDSQAISALRNTLAAARAEAGANGAYPPLGALPAASSDVVVSGPSLHPEEVSAFVSGDRRLLLLAARSPSGACWVVAAPLDAADAFGRFTGGSCDASVVDPAAVDGAAFTSPSELAPPHPLPGTDLEVLHLLFELLDGPNWLLGPERDAVVAQDPCSSGPFVVCNEAGRITELRLAAPGLSGELPPEIGLLTELEVLDLSQNNLSGELPAELGSLSKLRHLHLHLNQFSGDLPASLQNLVDLEELRLFDNRFSGPLPEWLGGLAHLSVLELNNNAFTGTVPSSWEGLSALEHLNLAGNQLSGELPDFLMDWPSTEVGLSHNGCLTASAALGLWLDARSPGWDNGC